MAFKGSFTALVTPFDKDDNLDEEGSRQNIRSQIREGIDGIVPVGTTGECSTLSYEEHEQVIKIAVDEAGGKVPVIAGTGSNSTQEALMLTGQQRKREATGLCSWVLIVINLPRMASTNISRRLQKK